MKDKKFKASQAKYFEAQMSQQGDHFNKYVVEYLEWKVENLYKAYRGITPTMEATEAKALATRLDGGITAIQDILKRMKG